MFENQRQEQVAAADSCLFLYRSINVDIFLFLIFLELGQGFQHIRSTQLYTTNSSDTADMGHEEGHKCVGNTHVP